MSYDLAVFDPSAAPIEREAFRQWFNALMARDLAPDISPGDPMPFDAWLTDVTGGAYRGEGEGGQWPDDSSSTPSTDPQSPGTETAQEVVIGKLGGLSDAALDPVEIEAWLESRMSEMTRRTYPQTVSPPLRAWLEEMSIRFPRMNGPGAAPGTDDPSVTDYDMQEHLIYCAFARSVARDAYNEVLRLARKYSVGFYDVSGDGEIWRPDVL